MARALTKKQERFVEEYAKTDNGTQAVLAHYDTENPRVAAAIASENLTKPNIQQALEEVLPNATLYEIHREGLFATKPYFDKDGNKIAEDADYNVRHKYLDTAYKIKNTYPKGEGTTNKTLILNITSEIAKRYGLLPNESSS